MGELTEGGLPGDRVRRVEPACVVVAAGPGLGRASAAVVKVGSRALSGVALWGVVG